MLKKLQVWLNSFDFKITEYNLRNTLPGIFCIGGMGNMKTMAVICEYNPFHNGHKYQLQEHKKELGADSVVCLMSGSFVQRGAPAVYDKWTRSKDAVNNGADLVLELPVVYSAQSARRFAVGAIKLLDKLGIVDFLSFGSECGDIELLKNCSKIVNSDNFATLLDESLKLGLSYPLARTKVLEENYPDIDKELINSPNNILSIEYLNALKNINSKIKPKTIKRNFDFASASLIREKLKNSECVDTLVPTETRKTYDTKAFDNLVLYHFTKESEKALQYICDMSEGLEHKFKKALKDATTCNELAECVKSKRYTRTRIDRIIVNSLLGIYDEHTKFEPQYARVLAFNDKGQQLLSKMKKTSSIPIITKLADAKPTNKEFEVMLKKDILSTDIYSIITNNVLGLDFKTSPKIINAM